MLGLRCWSDAVYGDAVLYYVRCGEEVEIPSYVVEGTGC